MDNFGFYKTILDNFLQKNNNPPKNDGDKPTNDTDTQNANLLNFLTNQGDENGFSLMKILTSLIQNFKSNKIASTDISTTPTDVNESSFTNKNTPNVNDNSFASTPTRAVNQQSVIPVSVNPLIGALKRHEDFVNRVKNGKPNR